MEPQTLAMRPTPMYRHRVAALLAAATLLTAAGCGQAKTQSASREESSSSSKSKPELDCKERSFSTPDHERGATGADSAEEAAAAYLKEGTDSQIVENSDTSATVYVMTGNSTVAAVQVKDYGDGWLIDHAEACAE